MRRRKKSNIVALVGLLGAVVLLATFGGFAYSQYAKRAQYDKETFCPKNGEYARTAILIDATDKLSTSQQKEIGDYLKNRLPKELDEREWVGFFVLNEDNLVLSRASFALCYPGGKDAANPLIENPRQREQIMQKRFLRPLQKTLADLVREQPPQDTSPILEMIEAVALNSDFDSTQQRRLIIVSDMLQNVPEYSHYKGQVDFEAFRQTDYGRRLAFSLRGVDVKIYYIKREDARNLQTRRHVRFWEDFFRYAGASVSSVAEIR